MQGYIEDPEDDPMGKFSGQRKPSWNIWPPVKTGKAVTIVSCVFKTVILSKEYTQEKDDPKVDVFEV